MNRMRTLTFWTTKVWWLHPMNGGHQLRSPEPTRHSHPRHGRAGVGLTTNRTAMPRRSPGSRGVIRIGERRHRLSCTPRLPATCRFVRTQIIRNMPPRNVILQTKTVTFERRIPKSERNAYRVARLPLPLDGRLARAPGAGCPTDSDSPRACMKAFNTSLIRV